jgi:hypothetical protein
MWMLARMNAVKKSVKWSRPTSRSPLSHIAVRSSPPLTMVSAINFRSTSEGSSAEARYLVLPMRPDGTAGLSEEQLAGLVTRDSMIGVQRL